MTLAAVASLLRGEGWESPATQPDGRRGSEQTAPPTRAAHLHVALSYPQNSFFSQRHIISHFWSTTQNATTFDSRPSPNLHKQLRGSARRTTPPNRKRYASSTSLLEPRATTDSAEQDTQRLTAQRRRTLPIRRRPCPCYRPSSAPPPPTPPTRARWTPGASGTQWHALRNPPPPTHDPYSDEQRPLSRGRATDRPTPSAAAATSRAATRASTRAPRPAPSWASCWAASRPSCSCCGCSGSCPTARLSSEPRTWSKRRTSSSRAGGRGARAADAAIARRIRRRCGIRVRGARGW